MRVNDRGSWLEIGGHTFDASLAEMIAVILQTKSIRSVFDFGCGDGSYTNYLNDCKRDISCVGFDGNPNTESLGDNFHEADLSELCNFGMADCVLSLEVGEHIPQEFESEFIANVTNHAKRMIILSWAVPGQGGVGHVNERTNDYIRDRMIERGWICEFLLSDQLRSAANNCYWFKNTLLVFRRLCNG